MKPTIYTQKNMKGHITGYRASLGQIDTQGATKAEAADACELAVLQALRRLWDGVSVDTWNGQAMVISPDVYGWTYRLQALDFRCTSSGYSTREAAHVAACRHLAHVLWTSDVIDDAEWVSTLPVPASDRVDLIRYFTWQRGYRRLLNAGCVDAEIREILSGMKADPTGETTKIGDDVPFIG